MDYIKTEDLKEGDLICAFHKRGIDRSYSDEILVFMFVDKLHINNSVVYARRVQIDPFNKEFSIIKKDNILSTVELDTMQWGFLKYEGKLKLKKDNKQK